MASLLGLTNIAGRQPTTAAGPGGRDGGRPGARRAPGEFHCWRCLRGCYRKNRDSVNSEIREKPKQETADATSRGKTAEPVDSFKRSGPAADESEERIDPDRLSR